MRGIKGLIWEPSQLDAEEVRLNYVDLTMSKLDYE